MSEHTGTRILLVDDQPANLEVLRQFLESRGHEIFLAFNGKEALRTAARVVPELILLDVNMPVMDGFEVCRRLKQDECSKAIPVIFVTGRDQEEDVVAGLVAGGVDYVTKPVREAEVVARVDTHLGIGRLNLELSARNEELAAKNQALEEEIAQRNQLKGQLSVLSEREAERWGLDGFVGNSPTIQKIFADIRLLQESTTTSVLINGESGTGKELIARAIHFGSSRRDGPFVPVNCAAMPAELAESMLFGHVKGAFTGAATDRVGYFEMAHEGTVFLDEIGDMSQALQAKLLRVLEDGEIWRVGASEGRRMDFRLVTATNMDLQRCIQEGSFRPDLYFRVARFEVTAPPLRDRREDIPLLFRHFLKLYATEMGREPPNLDTGVLESLQQYGFPGNVRELKNIAERALIESGGTEIQPHHLHFLTEPSPMVTETVESKDELPPLHLPLDLDEAAGQAERWVVQSAMARANGNVSEAARLLGTNRTRVYRVLNQLKEESQ